MAGSILHCIPSMSGGGAERQLAYLCGGLGRLGWRVHVALTRRGPNWPRLESSGAVIHEISTVTAYDPRLFWRLRGLITKIKPDLVQAWLLQMEVAAGISALATRTPWIMSERASALAYPRSAKFFLRQQVGRKANAIVSNSAAGDEYWRGLAGDGPRRFVVPNAVPVEEIAAVSPVPASAAGTDSDRPLILFAGRLDPQKNIDVLLRALGLVLGGNDAHVLCCGEGDLRGRIDEWIAAEGLGQRATVTGYEPQLWGIMKRSHVFVSPSLFEGQPNVVMEAMACGLPLVVSDIPEHREFLDECAARIVAPESVEDLAAAIEDVLRNPGAAAARARVARDRVAPYDIPAMARRYDEVYRTLLAEPRYSR